MTPAACRFSGPTMDHLPSSAGAQSHSLSMSMAGRRQSPLIALNLPRLCPSKPPRPAPHRRQTRTQIRTSTHIRRPQCQDPRLLATAGFLVLRIGSKEMTVAFCFYFLLLFVSFATYVYFTIVPPPISLVTGGSHVATETECSPSRNLASTNYNALRMHCHCFIIYCNRLPFSSFQFVIYFPTATFPTKRNKPHLH